MAENLNCPTAFKESLSLPYRIKKELLTDLGAYTRLQTDGREVYMRLYLHFVNNA
jgi:hypothetical protein